jgi:capsular exopolysaccharide synthesis family protein
MNTTASRQAVGDSPDGGHDFRFSASLVTLAREVTGVAESFRALRTHIMAQHVHEGRRALAVCAATAGVGCTYVAANLAVSLSQIGVKTLLIDVNLRNPGIQNLFRSDSPIPGLEQCLLSDDVAFGEYIQPEVLPDLAIMFAGGIPYNPQELLAKDRFAGLMNYCLRDYDMTILDTPPANSCSDVHRVSTVVGYSMIVTQRDKTRVSDVRQLIHELEIDRARVVGTVLTEL